MGYYEEAEVWELVEILNLNKLSNIVDKNNMFDKLSGPKMEQRKKKIIKIFKDFVLSIMVTIKGTVSGLRQYLATESSIKMMKNAFYFTLKALFFLQIFWSCRKTAWLER